MHTAPSIASALLDNLHAWHNGTPPVIPHANTWGERDAVLVQQQIGWTNIVFGRWTNEWGQAQQRYIVSQGSKLTIRRWTAAIIYKLYMTAWDMWEHRNHGLHDPGGVKTTAEVARLDEQIRQEYLVGPAGLQAPDRHLLRESLQATLACSVAFKRKWVSSLQLARRLQPDATELAGQTQLQWQRQFMHLWLHRGSVPP